jgi:hypothetical protein
LLAGKFRQARTKQTFEINEVGSEISTRKDQPRPVFRSKPRDPPDHELVRINPFRIDVGA